VSEQTIVCVLGMHRSGTSLVARVLNVLGLDLGPEDHLMRFSEDNPAGHWESRPIKEINDETLRAARGHLVAAPPVRTGLGAESRAGRASEAGARADRSRFLGP